MELPLAGRGPQGAQGAPKGPMALPQRLGRVPHRLLGLQGLIPNGVVPMRPQGPMSIPQSQGTKGVAGHQAQPPTLRRMAGHQAQPTTPKTLLPSATVLVGTRTVTLAKSAFHWGVGLPRGRSRIRRTSAPASRRQAQGIIGYQRWVRSPMARSAFRQTNRHHLAGITHTRAGPHVRVRPTGERYRSSLPYTAYSEDSLSRVPPQHTLSSASASRHPI